MKGPFIGRAVSEEAQHHLVGSPVLAAVGSARGNGNSSADNAVGPQDAEAHVHDVHGTSLSVAVAVPTAQNLRHHLPQIRSPGDQMPVSAVRAADIIIRAEHSAGPCGNCFFPDIKMRQSGHLSAFVKLKNLFFKAPYTEHIGIHGTEKGFVLICLHCCIDPFALFYIK